MAEHDEYITIDLSHQDHLNDLVIENALDDDNTVARLSPETMDKLELFCGDTVKLKGKKRRETICIVLSDNTCRDDRIRVNHVTQNNLRVHSGDVIVIQECPHVQYGKHIHVLPIDDTVNGIISNLLQEYLQPYFLDTYRPVYAGDTFTIQMGTCAVEFKVISTEPGPYCIVAPETVIYCEGEPIKREVLIDEIDFDDIGGLEDAKKRLKELVQYSIEHQEVYHKFNMVPSRDVLLYGPRGCGKTMLAKALANECGFNFISINSTELLSMSLDNTEDNVRNIFDKARQSAPCILFIDELDCLCYCRGDNVMAHGNVRSDRLINQLLTEIDGMSSRTKVFIIGATTRPDMIDRTLLRPGRLDQTIYIPLPDEKTRHAILKIVLQKWPVAKDVDLTLVARVSAGLSGADINEICRRACKMAIRESIENKQKLELSNPHNAWNVIDPINEIRPDHFENAMVFPRCPPSFDDDIRRCEMFAQRWQSSYSYDSLFCLFKFPQDSDVQEGSTCYTDDDDLYG